MSRLVVVRSGGKGGVGIAYNIFQRARRGHILPGYYSYRIIFLIAQTMSTWAGVSCGCDFRAQFPAVGFQLGSRDCSSGSLLDTSCRWFQTSYDALSFTRWQFGKLVNFP